MEKFEKVLNELDKLKIDYKVIGDMLGNHAFVDMDSNYYHLEIVDYNNVVGIYAFYYKNGQEIIYFKKDYKQVASAVKKAVALYKDLND